MIGLVAFGLFVLVRIVVTLPYLHRPNNRFHDDSSSRQGGKKESKGKPSSTSSSPAKPSSSSPPLRTIPTLVVLGSGGHTTEMLKLVSQLNPSIYTPIHYVYASTDSTSLSKLRSFTPLPPNASTTFHPLPRPREVGQSYLSSIVPTLLTLLFSLKLYCVLRPSLLLVNGPSTALPLVYVSYLQRVLVGWCCGTTKVIFVESFARVKTLSLTGKLCYPVADEFVVHWEDLARNFKKARYEGRII